MGPPVTEAQSGPPPPPPASLQPELGQPSGLSPLSSSAALLVKLVCRVLIAAMTFISLIVLATNTNFDAFFAYRYMMFVIVLALVYSLLQTALSIFQLTSGNRAHNSLAFLDFYGDLGLVYALATGAAAGFGITVDFHRLPINGLNELFAKSNATASLLFLSSVCSVVTLVLSRYMLFIILLALAYSLLQTAFSIFHLTSGKRVHTALAVFDYYGDLVLLYALATAAAAGFGASVEMLVQTNPGTEMMEFFGKGNATASMLFFASIWTAVSLILSK